MFSLRSAQGRAKVAILVLLALLVGLAALATWQAQKDRGNREGIEQRAAVVAALEGARAQLYRGAALLTAAVFAEDAAPYIDSYHQAQEVGDNSLEKARSTLAEIGETDQIAALDSFAERMGQLRQEVDSALMFAATADRPTRVEVGLQYYPQMWPKIEAMMGDLEHLSSEQQAALAAESAAADRASATTLIQLIGFGAFAILGGATTLMMLVVSVVRPLASLRESARAVASGDLETRAKVAGPEEVASLARDFNEMTDTLVKRSAQLQESEQRFRNVLDASRDFIYKIDLRTGTYDYASPSVLQLTGFTPEEVVAMGVGGVGERIYPEDGKRLTEEISDLTKDWDEGHRSTMSVYRWKRKDGEYRWFSDNSVFIRHSNEQPAALIGAVRDITAEKQAEQALRESEHDLKERAKELNCLYEISNLVQRPDISLEELLQGTVNLIPPAWQYPEIACARIVLGGQEYLTEHFRETAWRQTSDIIVNGERTGTVEICYLEEKPERDEGPFLTEERGLINAIAERLGRVSERKQVEETLRESEARYKALFAGAPEGMLVADLQTQQFRHANPAMCRMFGYTEEEFLRMGVADIHPKESLSHVLAEFEAQARGEILLSSALPCQRKDGSLFYANVNAVGVALDGRRCNVGFFTDVTDRKKAEEALREQARRDPLTGALNHGAIVDEMRSLISDGEQAAVWAVAMIDVNRLKVTNDTYGHQVGDAALVAVAAALSRDDAVVGRYGGDEFVAILPSADRNAAEYYRNKVMDALAKTTVSDPQTGASISVGASIGLAVYPENGSTITDLIKFSDAAMYATKRQRPFRRPSLRKHPPDRQAA